MVTAFTDWLAELGTNAGAASFLQSPAIRGSIVRQGLGFGMSGESILRGLRTAGIGMRTQNFYRLLGEMAASPLSQIAPSPFAALGLASPTSIITLEGGTAGRFMVNVRMYYQHIDENGDVERGFTTTSVLQTGAADLDAALRDALALWTGVKP